MSTLHFIDFPDSFGGGSVDAADGGPFVLILWQNVTLHIINAPVGVPLRFFIMQNASGGNTLDWTINGQLPSWPGLAIHTPPVVTAAAGSWDIFDVTFVGQLNLPAFGQVIGQGLVG